MQGSLCFKNGVLYVGRHAKTASVTSYDMDGHRLETAFEFRAEGGRSSASGLAVDEDHRVWVADEAAGALRAFTLFGVEVAKFPLDGAPGGDRAGQLGSPVDVCASGADDDLMITVASAGTRRHAVQRLHVASGRVASLRPLGDPDGYFRDVCAIAECGRMLYVGERRGRRVQAFRDDEFHFDFRLTVGTSAQPIVALAPLAAEQLLVGIGGARPAIVLVDEAGRIVDEVVSAERDVAELHELVDIEVAPGRDDRTTCVAALDMDGDRIQVFTLTGHNLGTFTDLPRT